MIFDQNFYKTNFNLDFNLNFLILDSDLLRSVRITAYLQENNIIFSRKQMQERKINTNSFNLKQRLMKKKKMGGVWELLL